jgi:hypothetical protein
MTVSGQGFGAVQQIVAPGFAAVPASPRKDKGMQKRAAGANGL